MLAEPKLKLGLAFNPEIVEVVLRLVLRGTMLRVPEHHACLAFAQLPALHAAGVTGRRWWHAL